jgi:SAM-dependent methyltransferase
MPAFDYCLVADIYDKYVKTDLDVAFFREESGKAAGRVLELMCGTGRLTMHLLAAGVSLTCVDSSPHMLSLLREKLRRSGLSADVIEQDVTCLSLQDKYALAIIPFNSFSEITATSPQLAALASIRRHLLPGGKLIVTLHNPIVRLKRIDGLNHAMGRFPLDERGNVLCLNTCEHYDPSSGMVTGQQVFEASDEAGGPLWRRAIDIAFRLFTLEQFEDLAARTGFRVEAIWGNYDRSPFVEEASPFIICNLRN